MKKSMISVSDDNIQETLPLIADQIKREGLSIKLFDAIGGLTTFMAMVPQGILGALLMDKILLSLNNEFDNEENFLFFIRFGVDSLLFITAEEGKRRLVRYFNTETFKNFGRRTWWKNTFFVPWSSLDILSFTLNASFTIVASAVFSGIAAMSFDGIAELLEHRHTPTTDTLSIWAKSYYVKAPFMLATFISNVPFFPFAHKLALRLLYNVWQYGIENPEFRRYKQTMIAYIRAAKRDWKNIHKNPNLVGKDRFLTAYKAVNDHRVFRLIEIGRASNTEIRLESHREFMVKHSVAIGLSGLGVLGLYNFLDMTDRTAVLFHVEEAAPFLCWMDYLSMALVAISAIYNMATTLTSHTLFRQDDSVNLIPHLSYVWIIFSSIVVSILGGFPNAYQSTLAGESLAIILIAAIDSLLIEVNGYYQLTKNKKIAALSKGGDFIREAYEIDTEIEEAISQVENATSVEAITEFSGIPITTQPYRPSYIALKNRFFSSASDRLSINQVEDQENQRQHQYQQIE